MRQFKKGDEVVVESTLYNYGDPDDPIFGDHDHQHGHPRVGDVLIVNGGDIHPGNIGVSREGGGGGWAFWPECLIHVDDLDLEARRRSETEGVVLVAIHVQGATKKERQDAVMGALLVATEGNDDSPIEEWWIADDERYDGSDNDSAVFVEKGRAYQAFQVLNALDLTEEWNDPR